MCAGWLKSCSNGACCASSNNMTAAVTVSVTDLSLTSPLLAEILSGVLARGLPFRFRAAGSSMVPFIRDGDVLTLLPLPARGPQPGDVVAFCFPGQHLAVHRVIRATAPGYLLKGDNYPPGQTDGIVPREDILGRVSRVERNGRSISFGAGPERRLIALFSCIGLLFPMLHLLSLLLTRFRPRQKK
jgi:hypothetical protein